ncbi:KN motif and ankyrin repeat domain-containing protein 3 [Hippocampus zosterae]|uniref:KN motif and ankyrin repeat domain-containing protein 3 n=1 Tax=Hippocampus zosterae TaxID=109293 RepID=UPI00223E48D6|nr:KN motif and ankyrin repeat domain-containing protein 3 [Hippocampus zosterae]XP_051928679.1 KN motif and ankyrin repeat domain-containing protein 3 [Hippocampus zosterae]XP_051928680.1 KN motif and ankyrin repeat domain-containing protein 3 [Hippocampus zosterae]XP_051928681.1 KN motif and ankyrin repeat domain-containing protein 3 [Hippocampus zosterae]XP_051928682.1 KN motif and ankyrin repeat domain-containing protein 3 [Hippocampus zosterae]
MTQSVQVNPKLPDLASPFLYSSQEQVDQPSSYSVQTPYGFQLDLDFLKYVEEIESGHNLRRAAVTSRRSGRGLKTSQRYVGGRASGWTSTESLSSPASEDGRVPPLPPPRNRLGSAPCEVLSLSPVTLLSVPPLTAGAKVPPPPPQRNARVERTLLETSRRLQQEQSHHDGGRFQLADPPKHLSASASTQPLQSSWTKPSPQTSGLNTPAAGTAVPPSQLQTVREQMATALKQLKEMEERVKGVPALEKEVAELRVEKDMLLLALQEKKATKKPQLVDCSSQTTQSSKSSPNIQSRLSSPASPGHKGHKSEELKKLAEKFEGKDGCAAQLSSKVVPKAPGKPSVDKKSVAVGDDQPIDSIVFYYSHSVKDATVGTELHVREKGTGTENPVLRQQGTQVRAETAEVGVWVMESLLGLTSEAQRELDTLQDTIKFQQESITSLESQLSSADKDLRTLRAQIEEMALKITFEKGVLAKPVAKDAQIETTPSTLKDAGVLCCPAVTDVCVGNSFAPELTEQSAQTDTLTTAEEPVFVVMATIGCQYENMLDDKSEDQKVTVLKKRQLTINDYKIFPEEAVSVSEEREQGHGNTTTPDNLKSETGMLKSIMKRKDGAVENRTTGKKNLQFVGILNGGYESTSSEEEEDDEEEGEEEEEGSSSEGSGEADCLDSTEEDEVDLQEETSEEERNVNLDESDTDEEILRASKGSSDGVKEKFELSSKMREACLILKNHLNDDIQTLKSKEVLASTHLVQLEWFRVSSAKMAQPSRVSDYLMAFSEVSALLLEHVVNMTDGNGNTALHYSVSHSNFGVVDLLLDTGMCCVDKQNKAGYTAIMLAALSTVKEDDDMSVVKKLFSKGNVNAKASQACQTALMLAVSHGRQEMVEALLECGGDVNVQDDEGSTALMCASEHGRAEIVKLLLEQPGCDISIVDNDGSNALSIAVEASHNDTAVLLYAHMNYAKTQSSVGSPKSPRSPTSCHKSWPAE